MKNFLCAIILVILQVPFSAFAQKLYVWSPDAVNPIQRPLFESTDTVDIVIFDGRTIPQKSKIEFSSDELIECITSDLQHTYEGATFNILPKAKYYKEVADNHVTIKLGITAYQAGFGADVDVAIGSVGGSFSYGIATKGSWNAITSFYVRVYDRRNGTNVEQEKEFVSRVEKPNLGGYKTAKKCLKESYAEVSSKMYFFIDSVFML